MGFTAIITAQPKRKAVKASTKIILKFEKPKTFSESKSALDFIDIKYHIAAIKIIKGSKFIIKFGIKANVKIKGRLKPISKSLKNSISSKKFNIIPRQTKTSTTFKTDFKKPNTKYLLITLFIIIFVQMKIFYLT